MVAVKQNPKINNDAYLVDYAIKLYKRGDSTEDIKRHFRNHAYTTQQATRSIAKARVQLKMAKANPTRTSTDASVKSPTKTSTETEAYTSGNVTVTGGAGAGATTKVTIVKKNPKGKTRTSLSVPDRHQLRILKQDLRMSDAGFSVMGVNSSKAETRKILRDKFGYTEAQIRRLENPKGTRVTKSNSTVSEFKDYKANKLSELAQQFQGQHNGMKKRVAQSDYTPKQTYRLGHLVQMKVLHNGKKTFINFDGDQVFLAADFKNGLHIVGKDAIIGNVKLPQKNGLTNIGKLLQVDYVTNKNHIGNNETIRFYHKLGEATKEMPNLLIDHEGFPIITGGGYDVWDVGIVN
jgi:hypothetical protein